jgi:hypothetical protein
MKEGEGLGRYVGVVGDVRGGRDDGDGIPEGVGVGIGDEIGTDIGEGDGLDSGEGEGYGGMVEIGEVVGPVGCGDKGIDELSGGCVEL